METHRKLSFLGAALLVATFLLNQNHQDNLGIGFNYAYITGIGMLACFLISFVIFTKDRIRN